MSSETDDLDATALGIAARVLADQSEIDIPPTRANIAIYAKQAGDIICAYLEASQALQSARLQGRIEGMLVAKSSAVRTLKSLMRYDNATHDLIDLHAAIEAAGYGIDNLISIDRAASPQGQAK